MNTLSLLSFDGFSNKNLKKASCSLEVKDKSIAHYKIEKEKEKEIEEILNDPVDLDTFNYNNEVIKRHKKESFNEVFENEKIKILLKILVRKIFDDYVYVKRLYKEFKLILQFRFEEVFFQVHQILKLSNGIPHIIRGSAGSCLLCFLMGITNIDPINEDIALSRFMHKTRQDIPDIDIDFPSNRRDDIYKKIFTNWEDKVARISNHIMFKEKSAIREAIRKEGYRKFVPRDFDLTDIFDDGEKIKKVKDNAKELIGSLRCYSLHCGGIVIFNDNVPDNLLLKEFDVDKNGFMGKQIWMNKDQVEDASMIKIDILSNRGLSQLWDISQMPIIDYPINDEKTLQIFKDGQNIGLTHSESRAMMKVFKTMSPTTVKEIAIALALIRPAASKNYQKAEFLKDYTPYKYNSNEFIIFDDDATLFIQKLLKCTDSVADNYRRAFSKNKKYKKIEFINKLKRMKFDEEKQEGIIKRLEQLEFYSFCKSHAFSYAQLVFALAYHKAHNPKKFWHSTINNCNSSYRRWVHFREAINSGLKILPGKKPFYLKENVLCPNKIEKKFFKDPRDQLINYGYWVTKEFIPDMYYEEYWTNVTKRHKIDNKLIIENDKMKYAKFKGIIVTGRGYKKDDNKGYITFVTIASKDCVYHDLVLYGYHKISKMICLSGHGKIKTDGYVTWIDVIKWKSEWI